MTASTTRHHEGAKATPDEDRRSAVRGRASRASRAVRGPGAERGFTLVEILVAMVVAGILAGSVVMLLVRQNDFYGQNDETIFAEQSARAVADLISSELRMASPGDILAADDTRLELKFDVLQAIVCGTSGSDVYLFLYQQTDNANLPTGRGTTYSNPYSSSWAPDYDGFDGSGSQSSTARTECEDAGAPDTGSSDQYRTADWSGKTLPEQGAVVRVFGTLTYSIDASTFSNGLAIERNGQELVSPFAEGARFVFRDDAGAALSTPVSSSELADIRSVRLEATATGDGGDRWSVERDLQIDISLRNREN